MTDQPSTQERGARCVTCGAYHTHLNPPLNVEEGNAPAVGDGTPDGQATPSNDPAKRASSTTQEAEKALETIEGFTRFGRGLVQDFLEGQEQYEGDMQWADDALAALRSLRTQHTKDQERGDYFKAEYLKLFEQSSLQHTEQQAEIERLKTFNEIAIDERDSLDTDLRAAELRITKDREEIERLKAETHMLVQQLDKAREDRTWTQRTLRARHTKDRERIADLERVLASLGQLTAGGSGDAAGSEVE